LFVRGKKAVIASIEDVEAAVAGKGETEIIL
jgi:hypothetical protein